jgi:hypothetical protein
MLIIGVFLIFHSNTIKENITSTYKTSMEKSASILDKEKKQELEKELTHLERGEVFRDKEHNVQDFIHKDYFGEPWRDWKNSYIIWKLACNYFLVLFGLMITKELYQYLKSRRNFQGMVDKR